MLCMVAVVGKPELALNSALDRLITAGLPFRQLGGGDSKSDKVEGSQNVKFPLPAIEPIHLLSEVQCFAENVIA